MVDLATVKPSAQAIALAAEDRKDPRLVELILSESVRVVRARPNVLIVEHGWASSWPMRASTNPMWPRQMSRSAHCCCRSIRTAARRNCGGVCRTVRRAGRGDHQRQFRPCLASRHRRRRDRCGRAAGADGSAWPARSVRPQLQVSVTGHADEIAAAASLVMGQGDEGQPVVIVRGLTWRGPDNAGIRAGAPGRRGHVPMSKRLVVALSGGIGGAKLVLGLSRVLPAGELLVVANTGDDFEHLGLSISPDIDTLTYILAGLDNPDTGWGRRDETWSFMDALRRARRRGLVPSRRSRSGACMSSARGGCVWARGCRVTPDICRRLGIGPRVLPMSDDRVRTRVRGDAGWIDFQDYFVRQQCRPVVRELAFDGARYGAAAAGDRGGARAGRLRAVIICPPIPSSASSRSWRSRACATRSPGGAPVIAVSPIIGGQAVKGPTAKMMSELGMERVPPVSPRATATCFMAMSWRKPTTSGGIVGTRVTRGER